jgi:CubicO group peptidase (beta-lactamase class C family)
MTRDQLTPGQKAGAGLTPDFFDTRGWSCGMAVWTAESALAPNPGRYGWDGGFGTSWANDPTSRLIGIMMTQSAAYYVAATPFTDFWAAANGAASA